LFLGRRANKRQLTGRQAEPNGLDEFGHTAPPAFQTYITLLLHWSEEDAWSRKLVSLRFIRKRSIEVLGRRDRCAGRQIWHDKRGTRVPSRAAGTEVSAPGTDQPTCQGPGNT
jgi:hypothetical protein